MWNDESNIWAIEVNGNTNTGIVFKHDKLVKEAKLKQIKTYSWQQEYLEKTRTGITLSKSKMGEAGKTIIPISINPQTGFIQVVCTSQDSNAIGLVAHNLGDAASNTTEFQYISI